MDAPHCLSCGAPLETGSRFAKVITCDFCGQVMLLKRGLLEDTGRRAALVDLPSKLYLDALGTLDGRAFRVLGRLQYVYDDGQWTEWFVLLDEEDPAWLVEDEGTYILYHKQTLTGSVPPFESARVGEPLSVNGQTLLVTEKGEARIAGAEGQLAFRILPNEQVQYIDGTSGSEVASLEYATDEVEFLTGHPVEPDAIVVEDRF